MSKPMFICEIQFLESPCVRNIQYLRTALQLFAFLVTTHICFGWAIYTRLKLFLSHEICAHV